jgi:hypothetical protein
MTSHDANALESSETSASPKRPLAPFAGGGLKRIDEITRVLCHSAFQVFLMPLPEGPRASTSAAQGSKRMVSLRHR